MPITNYPNTLVPLREGQHLGPRQSAPFTLAKLAQITTITIADASPAAAESWTLSVTDDETAQVYSITFNSGASLALTLDALVAAVAADGRLNDLFSATEDGATVATLTARHVGRSYTLAVTPGGSATAAVAISQSAGGNKLRFGRMLAVDSAGKARELEASDALIDLAGALFRTDFNHVQPFEPADARAGYDGAARGKTMSLMQRGRMVVDPETDPTDLSDPVYVRRALTSGSGSLGAFSAAAAGGQQLWTFTPSAINLPGYGFQFEYQGAPYTALYLGDGSTTVAQAVDGLVQDLGSISGLTITDNGTDLTIQTAAGTELTNVRNLASHTDVPVDSVTVAETTGEDIDMIDISSKARWETLPNAQGLAVVRFDLF